ncbi:hypothetical protein Tco_0145276 [Tanacetum coccineum]
MAGVDINTLTMEQYLALSQKNQAPGVVKPKIGGNVNFEIKSQFMRELREDTFSENKNEDAHDHIDRVFSIIDLFSIPEVSKETVMLRVFLFTLTGSAKRLMDRLALGTINTWGLLKKAFIQRLDAKFVKDLDKDCPLNEEVKQVKEVRYREFGRTTPFNGNNGGKFHVGPPGYYTKTDNYPPYGERRQSLEELLVKNQEESARKSYEMEVWIKKLQENAEINTRNQNASLKKLETQLEQLIEKLHSSNIKSEQAKVVIVEQEEPFSLKKLKNLHGVSFISDSQEENTNDQLPTKESNPGHFTLPCTIVVMDWSYQWDVPLSRLKTRPTRFALLILSNLRRFIANVVKSMGVFISLSKVRGGFSAFNISLNHVCSGPSLAAWTVFHSGSGVSGLGGCLN